MGAILGEGDIMGDILGDGEATLSLDAVEGRRPPAVVAATAAAAAVVEDVDVGLEAG